MSDLNAEHLALLRDCVSDGIAARRWTIVKPGSARAVTAGELYELGLLELRSVLSETELVFRITDAGIDALIADTAK